MIECPRGQGFPAQGAFLRQYASAILLAGQIMGYRQCAVAARRRLQWVRAAVGKWRAISYAHLSSG